PGYLLALYLEGPPVQPAAKTLRRWSPGLAHHSADEAWKLVTSECRNKSPVMNEAHHFRLSFQTEARFEPMLSFSNLFCFLDLLIVAFHRWGSYLFSWVRSVMVGLRISMISLVCNSTSLLMSPPPAIAVGFL